MPAAVLGDYTDLPFGTMQQEIIHWTGPYPFKYLKCIQCDHILCRWCLTTEVLTPLLREDAHPKSPFSLKDQALYGQICPDCGMSHYVRPIKRKRHVLNDRIVTFKGVKCPCGLVSDYSWLQFKVGSIENYRRNPYEAWFILTCQRAENSIRSRRASPERHARRSSRSTSISPQLGADGRPRSICLRPATSDGATASILSNSDESPRTAWSLRLHEADQRQDFIGRRPWDAPMCFVVDGL